MAERPLQVVFLDRETISPQTVLRPLSFDHELTVYGRTSPELVGERIANADITLICEAPKIGPHRPAMTAELSAMLGISPTRVSVKATTNEKLGFIGRSEGIAAIATASVVFPGEVPA